MATLEEVLTFGRGVERKFNCHVHDDTNASASVNVDKGWWYCYGCGAKGEVGNEDELPDFTFFHRQIERTLKKAPEIYPESWLDLFDAGPVNKYWLGRFSEQACREFRLGYDATVDKPCYPLRYPNGDVAGVVHRSINGEEPKYRYPYGVDIGKMLFNYKNYLVDELWLVEGAMDVIALHEAGITAFGIFGSRLKHAQVELITRCEPKNIVLCFDKDSAGAKARVDAANMLWSKGFNLSTAKWDSEKGKDPGELALEERCSILVEPLIR